MAGQIEVYVRRRRSQQDDARTGTLARGPFALRMVVNGRSVDVGEFTDGEDVLLEVDELVVAQDGATSPPPSRVAAAIAADAAEVRRTPELGEDA